MQQTSTKFKTRHDWVGKVIHWELCKRLKGDQTTKCYKHKSESVQENETHKILWDFEKTNESPNPASEGQTVS